MRGRGAARVRAESDARDDQARLDHGVVRLAGDRRHASRDGSRGAVAAAHLVHHRLDAAARGAAYQRLHAAGLPGGNGDSYPVLYMLDGGLDEDFPHVARDVDTAIRAGEMRPMIVVGIENTERRRDMTGPTTVASDRAIAPHVGGSVAFRAFIARGVDAAGAWPLSHERQDRDRRRIAGGPVRRRDVPAAARDVRLLCRARAPACGGTAWRWRVRPMCS